jgi:hypothetical protein
MVDGEWLVGARLLDLGHAPVWRRFGARRSGLDFGLDFAAREPELHQIAPFSALSFHETLANTGFSIRNCTVAEPPFSTTWLSTIYNDEDITFH